MLRSALICGGTVVVCVSLHLTVLGLLHDRLLPLFGRTSRLAVGAMVLGAIVGHLVEICIFAAAILLLASMSDADPPVDLDMTAFKAFYQSATTYTSLGAEPVNEPTLRLMTAIEALAGLILITWTASFVFLVMQRTWEHKHTP